MKVIRTDNGDWTVMESTWARAEEKIRDAYDPADGVLKRLAMGHPIRTSFAVYQVVNDDTGTVT